jgi:hypothetical protein
MLRELDRRRDAIRARVRRCDVAEGGEERRPPDVDPRDDVAGAQIEAATVSSPWSRVEAGLVIYR